MKKKKQTDIKGRPFWFYLVPVIIPILFFVLLEIILILFNYGIDNRQWIPASEGKLILNPEISKRYFYSSGSLPYSIQDVFDEVKPPNSLRIFVLGESSAAGYPYLPIGSFSRYLKKRLEIFYPEKKIEVINISMTAVNSYTIADLFPGVVEQKPDAVLIYTGHNEYYGALGVGSVESYGSSVFLVKTVLFLNKFRTVQLLRNIINSASKLFSDNENAPSDGTLMSRIAREKYIPFKSDLYNDGIKQFKNNMREIFETAKANDIKIICGNLTCNYKDQEPFISVDDSYPRADIMYNSAYEKLNQELLNEADSLFRFAKNLDALRFRAPSAINDVLKELCSEFSYPLLNIDSAFAAESPDGITGNNLMTDHLHPNLNGYFLMGNIFFNALLKEKILPQKVLPANFYQDSVTISRFNFSVLDSIIADYRIKVLKNEFPYRKEGKPIPLKELLNPDSRLDSIAFMVAGGSFTWEKAQREAAEFYLESGDKIRFVRQMDVLISQYPVISEFNELAASGLLKFKDFKTAFDYLENAYSIKPSAYSAKWIGTIYLSDNDLDKAIHYLQKSLQFNNADAQVHYNISGAFIQKKDYGKALKHVEECLRINPDYPSASGLRTQLKKYSDNQ